MFWFYIIAVIPILVGGYLFLTNKDVVWQEWLGSAALVLLCAIGFNVGSYYAAVGDVRTMSGEVIAVKRVPRWKEYYETAVYRTEYYTDSKGKSCSRQVFDHWESHTCWHEEESNASSNINTTDEVSRPFYDEIHRKFGRETSVNVSHSTFSHASKQIGGDYHDYFLENITGAIVPVVKNDHWVNKLKLDNTVYAFAPVPEDIKLDIPEYPECSARFQGNRLIGNGFDFTNEDLDKVNAKIGFNKHCNLIIVNFPYQTPDAYNEYLRSAWRGGKSNDLIIVTAGSPQKPTWTRVISWSDSELCKVQLANYVRDNGVKKSQLPSIQRTIEASFAPRDWNEFDCISVEPEFKYIGWYVFAVLVTQAGLWFWIVTNEFNQTNTPYNPSFKTNTYGYRFNHNSYTSIRRNFRR